MSPAQLQAYQKIARMALHEVPNRQIAMAMNLSDSRITQIMQEEEFRQVLADVSAEVFESQQIMNQSWDAVENIAVNHVFEALQHNPDPEFALKAAAVANRANRRGQLNHQPLQGNAGVRAVLQLNATFVEKLQQNFQILDRNARVGVVIDSQHDTDFLAPSEVEQLLAPEQARKQRLQQEIDEELADF